MKTRALLTSALLSVLLAATLTACGDGSEKDAAAVATTHACRSYVLVGGSDADLLAEELHAVISGTGSYNVEDVTSRVVAIRAAATRAGLVDNLPKKDFRLFAALADATLRTETVVRQQPEDTGTLAPAIGAYDRAIKAINARCR